MPISSHSNNPRKIRFSGPPSRSNPSPQAETPEVAREARVPDFDNRFTRFLGGAAALAATLAPHAAGATEVAVEQSELSQGERELQELLNSDKVRKRTRRGRLKRHSSGEVVPSQPSSGVQHKLSYVVNAKQKTIEEQASLMKALDNTARDRDDRPGIVNLGTFSAQKIDGKVLHYDQESGEIEQMHIVYAGPLNGSQGAAVFESVDYWGPDSATEWYREIVRPDSNGRTTETLEWTETKNGSIRYKYKTETPK